LSPVYAIDQDSLLDPKQAFAFSVAAKDGKTLLAKWDIAKGYYLYQERFQFVSKTPGIELGTPDFPAGKIYHDEFFGEMVTYRDDIRIAIPLQRNDSKAPAQLTLLVAFQGCADVGVCYPPETQSVTVNLSDTASSSSVIPGQVGIQSSTTADSALDANSSSVIPAQAGIQPSMSADLDIASSPKSSKSLLPGWGGSAPDSALLKTPQNELLEPHQAFVLSVDAPDANTLIARWDIAEGYYLYKDKLELNLNGAQGLRIKEMVFPEGKINKDEFFGEQEVFYQVATATAKIARTASADRNIQVTVNYQGCAEIGVCYPPMTQTVPVRLPALPQTNSLQTAESELEDDNPTGIIQGEQDRMANLLVEGRLWALPAFFGFGLMLAFTPCVLPMIPILSSLIAGQGKQINQRNAFFLSLIYVLAMSVTYTLAGVMAATLGQNIQVWFQNPWVLVGFSALFVFLALSAFGFFQLQVPAHWQSRLAAVTNRQRGGTYAGVATMGFLSALIVGPCVAPPLIGVLTVIATTGDRVLGGSALFAMSLGMGLPLLLIGTSAGHILPRVGHWMNRIKAVFGVLMLGVAIWILERVLPTSIYMLLWAVLLIVSATYMGALQPLAHGAPHWRALVKGLGTVLMVYGVLLLVGIAAGGKDPLHPLQAVGLFAANKQNSGQTEKLAFRPVKTVVDVQQIIDRAQGQPVMLDFYADWCVTCKELEKYTFTDPGVQAALEDTILLKADVTANTAEDRALQQHFGIFGPPAILFFDANGKERKAYRVVGFMPADRFQTHVQQALGPSESSTVSTARSM
jgi:thiol:disulfide interchange protein DsbD